MTSVIPGRNRAWECTTGDGSADPMHKSFGVPLGGIANINSRTRLSAMTDALPSLVDYHLTVLLGEIAFLGRRQDIEYDFRRRTVKPASAIMVASLSRDGGLRRYSMMVGSMPALRIMANVLREVPHSGL